MSIRLSSDLDSNLNLKHIDPIITIRLATEADDQAICDNERQCYEFPWTDKVLLESLHRDYHCYVMHYQSKMIGHMIIQQVLDEIHLHNVCVLPIFRGQSFGNKWVAHLYRIAKKQQVKTLILEVRKSNSIAIALYIKRGFQKVGLRKSYYRTFSGREDAVVMTAQVR